jgi:D-alanyl-D-alanine carboxypeptidase
VGVTAAVGVPGLGVWTRTTGLARRTPAVAVSDDSLFWWASAGKAYTACLVQLDVQQGRLALRDSIERWWPDFPEARLITLEHLLTHTSGIRSFKSGEFSAQLPAAEYRAPETIIAAVQGSTNLFCPGAYWSYSNTGYVMLGRVLEGASQRSYGELLRQRLFVPLGLRHSEAIEPGALPAGLVTRHPAGEPLEDAGIATPFAAGAIAARADDVLRFWHAWLTGRLLPRSVVQGSFARLYPMFEKQEMYYGQGVMLIDWKDAAGRPRQWLGHLGGAPGANAVMAYDPMLKAYVAVALNSDLSATATANALLQTLESWRDAEH